jgi:hypothetical protein
MPDDRNLLHHGLVDAIGREAVAMTARAQETLWEKSRPALHATPDANAGNHATPTTIPVTRASGAERNETWDPAQDLRSAELL